MRSREVDGEKKAKEDEKWVEKKEKRDGELFKKFNTNA